MNRRLHRRMSMSRHLLNHRFRHPVVPDPDPTPREEEPPRDRPEEHRDERLDPEDARLRERTKMP